MNENYYEQIKEIRKRMDLNIQNIRSEERERFCEAIGKLVEAEELLHSELSE